jgi:2'-5' RNA ligase
VSFAVELCLDAAAGRAVYGVWDAVRAAGGNSRLFDLRTKPHVSLAVYPEGARGPLEDAVAGFRAAALPFVLASAATFPGAEGVVYLAPVLDDGLLRLHREWHAHAPGSLEPYRPGVWVPHCTVGIQLPDAAAGAAVAAARAALPIRGRYESIALVEFDRDLKTPVRHLVERPLRPTAAGRR